MDQLKLKAKKRNILGKKVKKLRRENILPANLYGKGIQSCALQVKLEEFQKIFSLAGETTLVNLQIDDDKVYPVLIQDVSYNPLTENLYHASFYRVDLTENVTAAIPVLLKGEPEAIKKGEGILLTLLDEIEVEGLPKKLPSEIAVDVSHLTKIDEVILVKDLKLPAGIKPITGSEELICKIEKPEITEEEKKETVAEISEEEKEEAKEGEKKQTEN